MVPQAAADTALAAVPLLVPEISFSCTAAKLMGKKKTKYPTVQRASRANRFWRGVTLAPGPPVPASLAHRDARVMWSQWCQRK